MPSTRIEIPCGHCGYAVLLSVAHLMPGVGLDCDDCGGQIFLYVDELPEDIQWAAEIVANYRRNGLGG